MFQQEKFSKVLSNFRDCLLLVERIFVMDGKVGRNTSTHISALCLIVDKDQGLRSGKLS